MASGTVVMNPFSTGALQGFLLAVVIPTLLRPPLPHALQAALVYKTDLNCSFLKSPSKDHKYESYESNTSPTAPAKFPPSFSRAAAWTKTGNAHIR